MGAVELRHWGGTAPAAPIIKRATGHLSTNQAVMIVPDTNLPGALGSNVADGVSKIHLYLSADATRSAWTSFTFTPPVEIASYSKSAVCSMTVRSNNDVLIAYQGVDNSLHVAKATFSGGTYTGFTDAVVQSSGAVTSRFRAIDIDDCWPNKSVAVATYEATAATGQGAYARVYIRKDDEVTWVMAYESQIFTTQFIQAQTEDVSVAWNAAGVVSNVNQLAVYFTRCHTSGDLGDRVVELQVNVNTATTNSATTVGTWFAALNQSIASSSHRGWLFSEASGVWMFATAVGGVFPFFMSCRLYHNTFTNIVQNRTAVKMGYQRPGAEVGGSVQGVSLSRSITIRKDNFGPGAIACSFMDTSVVFGFSGYGIEKPYAARSVVMRYSSTTVKEAKSIDISPRMLDGGYNLTDGVIGIYGGDNHDLSANDRQYNFMAIYGKSGNTLPANWIDMFDRTVAAGGLGTSTSGQNWTPPINASDFSVNGSQGVVLLAVANSSRIAPLSGTTMSDCDVVADFSTSVLMTGGFSRFSCVARYQDGNNYLYGSVEFTETQQVRLTLHKRVATVDTQLGSTTVVAGLTHAANTKFRVHFIATGTVLGIRVWDPATQAEPALSQLAISDGTLYAGPGLAGVRGLRGSANTNANLNMLVDNFAVFTANASTFPGGSLRRARAIYEDAISAPVILSPANTVVSTNTATVRSQFQSVNLYSNVKGSIQFQLATDSAFTANVRAPSAGESGITDLSSVNGQTPPIKVFDMILSGANALFPGTWFLRSRLLSDLGDIASPYSPAVTFSVSHPPTAAPLSPIQGSSVLFGGSGTVTFAWKFSDTDGTDTQSAYQVTVVRTDTGAVVWDSGKIVSSAQSAANNFSSTLKDIPLQWSVSLWDASNTKGPSSTPVLFTVVDPPAVAITSPTSGGTVPTAMPTIAWSFTVGGTRTQRAYRVVLTDTDATPDQVIADTGWRMGADASYTFPASVLTESDVDVYTEDFELGVSGWSPTFGTLVQSTAHARTGTKAGLLTVTGSPTQTYVRQTTANRYLVTPGQTYKFDLWVFSETGQAHVPGVIDWQDSNGTLMSSSTTPGGTLPLAAGAWESRGFTVVAPANARYAVFGPTIANSPATGNQIWFDDVKFDAVNYQVSVSVQDTVGLQVTSSLLFNTDWISPAQATAVTFSDQFKMTVTWSNATQDTDFVGWRVYRRYMRPAIADLDLKNTATLWEMLYETTDVQTSYTFQDYMAPLNKSVEYAVVQVVDRFGSLVESRITSSSTVFQAGDRYYFVPEVPIGVIAAFEAANVTTDGFTREIEQATLHVKGRGRQQQIGDDLGYTGTLNIKLRNQQTARRDREFFEFLSGDDAGNVWLRSPFGDVLYVAFGNVQTNRVAGMGLGDIVDLTIPYLEVFSNLPITRLS